VLVLLVILIIAWYAASQVAVNCISFSAFVFGEIVPQEYAPWVMLSGCIVLVVGGVVAFGFAIAPGPPCAAQVGPSGKVECIAVSDP